MPDSAARRASAAHPQEPRERRDRVRLSGIAILETRGRVLGWPEPRAYVSDLQANSKMLVRVQKQTGKTETQSFRIQKSKPLIDEIDAVLAKHYGFSAAELDFIVNYDIKFRLGADEAEDDE